MHYMALVSDYDGTLAADGVVDGATLDALERLRQSGRMLVLATGRELDDLLRICPRIDLFDRVVAENGALLYRPQGRETRLLADPPPAAFVERLRQEGVTPLSVGSVIVATWQPNETIVLKAIRELGLELQIIFNKGAVMVLPPGINKSTGVSAALAEIGLSPHNAVGIGDAENDHAFLGLCGCSVAVQNALPVVKESADLVTRRPRGAGVAELIGRLLADDLASLDAKAIRRGVLLGRQKGGEPFLLPGRGGKVLLTGTSGAGKSTLTAGLLERLAEESYQFCVVDPEGDYEAAAGALVIGDGDQPPAAHKVVDLLERPGQSVVVNLLAIKLPDRPPFLAELLAALRQLRLRKARPHWVFIDEAHHMLPPEWQPVHELPVMWPGTFLITVHPDRIAAPAAAEVDTLLVLGQSVAETIARFRSRAGWPQLAEPPIPDPGEVLLFRRDTAGATRLEVIPPKATRRRHLRKYAEGKLGDDKSFYFRGPDGRLNLRAHNLELFVQMADGIDDATWLFHLRAGDYARWFRDAIKDEGLAAVAAGLEARPDIDASQSRKRIREAIEQRYTASA
ncbi:MAG TPA: HAD-IIB family hydrolase [Dongiaceae bacterium]|nr:HAD-IIB family hydrolase [Dongiaceae bacterium]